MFIAITELHSADDIETAEQALAAWMPPQTSAADDTIARARLQNATTGAALISSDEVTVYVVRDGPQVCVLVTPANESGNNGSVTTTCPSVVSFVNEGTWLSAQPADGPKTAVIVLPVAHAADTEREVTLVDTADGAAEGSDPGHTDSHVIDNGRAIIVTWEPPPTSTTTTLTITSESGELSYPFEHSDPPPAATGSTDESTGGSGAVTTEEEPFKYQVQPGDTLKDIAARFNVTVDSILAINPDIDPVTLRVESFIDIPGASNRAAPTDGQVAYLPGGDWEIRLYLPDVTSPARGGETGSQLRMATPNEGVFGPAVWTHFNPGLDRIDYGPPGGRTTTTPAGTEVRVAQTISDASPLAIKLVEGGSIVVNGYDITEAELLQIVDTIDRIDGALVWNGDPLPRSLEALPPLGPDEVPSFDVGQYGLQQLDASGEPVGSVNVITVPEPLWQIPLNARATHPGWELTEINDQPAIVYGYSPDSGDDAGAIYVLDGTTYKLHLQRLGPQDPYPDLNDVLDVLEQIEAFQLSEIADQLGLVTRQEIYTEWLQDINLPPSTDIEWLLTNTYTNVGTEAFFAHQVFACLWAGEWIATGDQAALDMIDDSPNWPTATLIAADRGAAEGEQIFLPGPTIENPDGATPAERVTDALRQDCGFVLGDDL